MTRPRRVLTVVVERCSECQWFGVFVDADVCLHEGRRKYAPAGAKVVAWLRAQASERYDNKRAWYVVVDLADAIERGEHEAQP